MKRRVLKAAKTLQCYWSNGYFDNFDSSKKPLKLKMLFSHPLVHLYTVCRITVWTSIFLGVVVRQIQWLISRWYWNFCYIYLNKIVMCDLISVCHTNFKNCVSKMHSTILSTLLGMMKNNFEIKFVKTHYKTKTHR